MSVRGKRGQSMVEFAMTIGLLMLLVVSSAQLAIFLHYRSSLDLAIREGAFQASLVGHSSKDGDVAARELWHRIQPDAGPLDLNVSIDGRLVVVTASAYAPALLPMPAPPFNQIRVQARAVHTVERFQFGSNP
jgi:Flp pilus assembly protein TadG